MTLTSEQITALRKVVRLKLACWDAASNAEHLLQRDIATVSETLDGYCAMVDSADEFSDEMLVDAFELRSNEDSSDGGKSASN